MLPLCHFPDRIHNSRQLQGTVLKLRMLDASRKEDTMVFTKNGYGSNELPSDNNYSSLDNTFSKLEIKYGVRTIIWVVWKIEHRVWTIHSLV